MEENKKTDFEEADAAAQGRATDGSTEAASEKAERNSAEAATEQVAEETSTEQVAEETSTEQAEEETSTDSEKDTADGGEKSECDLGLDRESLSDEEYIEKLEEKLGQCLADSAMCRGMTQRLQADFDNYRKRNASAGEDMKQLGISLVVEKMLDVLDNCDLARKYLTDSAALTGFNMMETQIVNALESFGLKEVEADGKDFDPKFMNAVERVKNADMDGKVVEVLAKGYTLNGRLLRPASVKVGSAKV
jgi:molecular chaperone GrpE